MSILSAILLITRSKVVPAVFLIALFEVALNASAADC